MAVCPWVDHSWVQVIGMGFWFRFCVGNRTLSDKWTFDTSLWIRFSACPTHRTGRYKDVLEAVDLLDELVEARSEGRGAADGTDERCR